MAVIDKAYQIALKATGEIDGPSYELAPSEATIMLDERRDTVHLTVTGDFRGGYGSDFDGITKMLTVDIFLSEKDVLRAAQQINDLQLD